MFHPWRTLGRKLPLMVSGLLVVTVAVIDAMTYREMKRSLLLAAGERMVSTAQRITAAIAPSNERTIREGTPLSRDTTLIAGLTRRSPAAVEAVRQRFARERANNRLVLSIELWSADGSLVLTDGSPPGGPLSFEDMQRSARTAPLAPLGAFRDTILSETRFAVVRPPFDTVGYIRVASVLGSSPQAKQLLTGLLGDNMELLIGNAAGDVWTDLEQRVEGPGVATTDGGATTITDSKGIRKIGAIAPISRLVPRVVWVGIPEAVVTAQMTPFLVRMILVSLFVIVAGTAGAWAMSRRVIAPLVDVTQAAERLAAGNYGVRVATTRDDEVGRLAQVFNDMAGAIESATSDLEQQQVELETQQIELEETNEELRHNIAVATRARTDADRSQVRAAAIVAGAIDPVIAADADGAIVEFNPAAEATFGLTAPEAMGRRLDQFIPAIASTADGADAGGSQTGTLARYVESRQGRVRGNRDELLAVRADGTEFSVELAITRIPLSGPSMFTCFLRDLSERKQLEAQLQQAQKMEAIGRLAGGVAHDFNNMLTVIISYADLVLADSSIATDVRNDLVQVRSAADRASVLTRQLLAFSRKQVLRPAVLDLNTVVSDVSKMLSRVVPENIRLDTKLYADVYPIYVDRGQLEQVLMNLAVNARDAMPNGGSLILETINADLDDSYGAAHPGGTTGPHAVLLVRDTGIGMDAATRERAFEPFFTTKPRGQGTGLGLSTVYGIVRQSGGAIYVYSEPGRGTTFKVYFPAYSDSQTSTAMLAAPAPDVAGPATILLVEDDPAVRDATRIVLERLGHKVIPTPDVKEALNVLRVGTAQPDVVLTDAVMPGQSGLDLADILATERPGLPVVLMSGYSEETVSGGRAMPQSVVFVEKPFTGAIISRALTEVRRTATPAS